MDFGILGFGFALGICFCQLINFVDKKLKEYLEKQDEKKSKD